MPPKRRGLGSQVRMSEPLELGQSYLDSEDKPADLDQPVEAPIAPPPRALSDKAPAETGPSVTHPAFGMPRRTKGARHEKVSGLHIRLEQIKQNGFDHPVASKNFLMVPPDDFLALLALEPLAVIQVVFVILRETVGWDDTEGLHGRREWIRLSAQDFERRGIAGRAQARRGLKRAEDQGYIRKKAVGNGFEYAMRWADAAHKESSHNKPESM